MSEGANTMDIGRTILSNSFPKHRLDAATFGTMGVGLASAIAAKGLYPDKKVICVLGDSAFGFSAMELETIARYKLNMVVVIINNHGIARGSENVQTEKGQPNTALANELMSFAAYEKVSHAFNGKGVAVKTHGELDKALAEAMAEDALHVLNVFIDPDGTRKPQEFEWLTKTDDTAKL